MYPSALLQLSPFTYTLAKCVVVVHPYNGNASEVETGEEKLLLSIAEYRKLLNDYSTSEEHIQERIDFLVRYARKIIKEQLKKICQK